MKGPARATRPGRASGVALMLGGALSNQTGAAVGALAFPVLGPAGIVAVRQWVAAAVLLAAGRPRWREFSAAQWRLILALAAVFAIMNLSLYEAIARIGLGLAVTLEFLGPLGVALAASRRRIDLACALAAGAAVVVLTRPQPSTNYLGIALALLAAACWACYILLNRAIGTRLPGVQGTAAAATLSALAYLPIGLTVLFSRPLTLFAIGCAFTTGILASALPFVTDLMALRRIPARLFGTFMSTNPVIAALLGMVILGERLPWVSWAAILVIVASNALALATAD